MRRNDQSKSTWKKSRRNFLERTAYSEMIVNTALNEGMPIWCELQKEIENGYIKRDITH